MDQDLNIKRAHNTELGFNTTRMTFVFGNIGAIAINSFADLQVNLSGPYLLLL